MDQTLSKPEVMSDLDTVLFANPNGTFYVAYAFDPSTGSWKRYQDITDAEVRSWLRSNGRSDDYIDRKIAGALAALAERNRR